MTSRRRKSGGTPFGAMAQLVAHLLCKQGVTGSSPVSSTSTPGLLWKAGVFLFIQAKTRGGLVDLSVLK